MLSGCAAAGGGELAPPHPSAAVVAAAPAELPSVVVSTPPLRGGTRSAGPLATVSSTTITASTIDSAPAAPNETVVAAAAPAPAASSETVVAAAAPAPTVSNETVVADAPAEPTVRSGADVSADQPVGEPLTISIPAIGVFSELLPIGVLADGTVAVPVDPFVAGWFTGGPRPGERGPAVIVGHVDSKKSGPGVFWDLVRLPVGSIVTITTTTGTNDFVVDAVERFPKDRFPTERIYGPVPRPALRLVTCGGSFDRSIGHYRDNVVAFLSAVPV
jgi:sortase (surface protein transpeptidase)